MEEGYTKASSNILPVVDALMVGDFMKNNPPYTSSEQRGVKLTRSSRENYGDSAVGFVQIKRDGGKCSVLGKVTPEHKIKNKPYAVSIVINEGKNIVEQATCHGCGESAGGCKHAIAFLMWLHRRSEEPSYTEVESYWQKSEPSSSIESMKLLKVKDMTGGVAVTHLDEEGSFRSMLINKFKEEGNYSNSLMALNLESNCGDIFIDKIMIDFHAKAAIKSPSSFMQFAQTFMEESNLYRRAYDLTKMEHKSQLWHQLRFGRVSASRAHAVMHCKKTDGMLVEIILGAKKLKDTAAMKRGRDLEMKVIEALEVFLKEKIESCGISLDPLYPILAASPDGVIGDTVIKVKCPQEHNSLKNYFNDGKISPKYVTQLMLQMLLMKKRRCIFAVADPEFEINNTVYIFKSEYSEEMAMDIVAACNAFWCESIYPVLNKRLSIT